jgi:8-oxo-dGTP pyrophosphatase MutT (NUDIX family)
MAPGQRTAFPFPVPVVSAIIERQRGPITEVLVQVRWKPQQDPLYSGTFEIPAGGIELYESVYDALTREVFEETGLRVTGVRPDVCTKTHAHQGDDVFAFVPFCCQQQLSGRVKIGVVLVCTVEGTDPVPARDEVKEILWLERSALRRLIAEAPERVFPFQVPVLEFYLRQCTDA